MIRKEKRSSFVNNFWSIPTQNGQKECCESSESAVVEVDVPIGRISDRSPQFAFNFKPTRGQIAVLKHEKKASMTDY